MAALEAAVNAIIKVGSKASLKAGLKAHLKADLEAVFFQASAILYATRSFQVHAVQYSSLSVGIVTLRLQICMFFASSSHVLSESRRK